MYSAAITGKHTIGNNRATFDLSHLKKLITSVFDSAKSMIPTRPAPVSQGQSEADIIHNRLKKTTTRHTTSGTYHPAVSDIAGSNSNAAMSLRSKQQSVIRNSSKRFERTTQERDHLHVESSTEMFQKYSSHIETAF